LSTWLRDYLYISLGGNRQGGWFTYRNVMLTMLIGGLWHGASWMFVVWGGLHGLYLCLEKGLARTGLTLKVPLLIKTVLTFVVVTLTWIPFRSADMATAGVLWQRLFQFSAGPSLGVWPMLLCGVATLGTLGWHFTQRDATVEGRLASWSWDRIALCLGAMLALIYLVSGGDEHAFIYFQF
jgi:hypothetical protein